jgi:hypothetical protein
VKLVPLVLLALLAACNSQEVELDRITPTSYFLRQMGTETAAITGGDYTRADQCNAMTVDKDLNTICAGSTLGDFDEPRSGPSDPLILKFDFAGNLLWATQLGTLTIAAGGDNSGTDSCLSVVTDEQGSIYCGGETSSTPGGGIYQGGVRDAMIIKLDKDGNLLWVKSIGTTGTESIKAITVKGDSLYVAGETNGSMVGSENTTAVGSQGTDAFVVKADLDGVVDWTKQLGEASLASYGRGKPTGNEAVAAIQVDSQGSAYVAGATTGSLMEARGGSRDGLVWKLAANGDTQLIKHYGQTTLPNNQFDKFTGLAIDTNDDIYVNGETSSNIGEAWASGNPGWNDVVVFKMTTQLAVVWKKQLGAVTKFPGGDNTWNDESFGIAVNKYGVYSLVSTNGPLIEANVFSFDVDTAIIKFNKKTGALMSGVQVGAVTTPLPFSSLGTESPRSIFADSRDRVYVGGSTASDLGETRGGAGDIFVFKLDTNLQFE